MLLRQAGMAFVAMCAGTLVSGGVFTVLLSVGLIPRFAGKTHTNRKVFLYEEMVVFGTVAGSILSLFPQCRGFGRWLLGFAGIRAVWGGIGILILAAYGLFAGIFVGSLALAIAEMLDSIPIFARRISFRHGLGVMITAMALGKMCGSLLYFLLEIYKTAQ